MRISLVWLSFAFLLLAVAATVARADDLRSPWDDLKVTQTTVAYDCPSSPPFAKTLEVDSYYIDSATGGSDYMHRSSTPRSKPRSRRPQSPPRT